MYPLIILKFTNWDICGGPNTFLMANASFPKQVMAYSSHSAQSNGFLQTAGKGAAPTAHRGVSAPTGCFPSQRQKWALDILEAIILLRDISPF